MTKRIIFLTIFLLQLFLFGAPQIFPTVLASSSETLNDKEYTYVPVFEDGQWWIYVYDGTVMIERYLYDD